MRKLNQEGPSGPSVGFADSKPVCGQLQICPPDECCWKTLRRYWRLILAALLAHQVAVALGPTSGKPVYSFDWI